MLKQLLDFPTKHRLKTFASKWNRVNLAEFGFCRTEGRPVYPTRPPDESSKRGCYCVHEYRTTI